MDIGSFTTGLLTGLREGVEAALIISIVLAYLVRTGNGHHASKVWLGTASAIGLSVVIGFAILATLGGLEGPAELAFEGTAMLLAGAVVTWMLFWMRRQAASVKSDLQTAVDRALDRGGAWGLATVAFLAVIREGVETSLFLTGQATAARGDLGAASVLVGALVGLVVAAVLGYGFYRGTRRINLARFFRWTGVALVFIAAGLISHAVHEFIELGLIGFGTATAFDLSGVLPHSEESGNLLGQFLRALFGYSATPEVATFVTWAAYIVVVLVLYLRPVSPTRPAPAATTEPAAS